MVSFFDFFDIIALIEIYDCQMSSGHLFFFLFLVLFPFSMQDIHEFSTLSPIPGFRSWLHKTLQDDTWSVSFPFLLPVSGFYCFSFFLFHHCSIIPLLQFLLLLPLTVHSYRACIFLLFSTPFSPSNQTHEPYFIDRLEIPIFARRRLIEASSDAFVRHMRSVWLVRSMFMLLFHRAFVLSFFPVIFRYPKEGAGWKKKIRKRDRKSEKQQAQEEELGMNIGCFSILMCNTSINATSWRSSR